MNVIKFYRVRGEKYGCFSNFSPHSFRLNSYTWPTSEHYFQAMKFQGSNFNIAKTFPSLDPKLTLVDAVNLCYSPRLAAEIGRRRDLPLRVDWEKVKNQIMHDAVFAKFNQNRDVKEILLSTGNAMLVEDSPTDYYWGCGAKGYGKNQLGKTLVSVRIELGGLPCKSE